MEKKDITDYLRTFVRQQKSEVNYGTYRETGRSSLLKDGLSTRANSVWKQSQFIVAYADDNEEIDTESYLDGWSQLTRGIYDQFLLLEKPQGSWTVYNKLGRIINLEDLKKVPQKQLSIFESQDALFSSSALKLQLIFYGAPGTGKSHTINCATKGEDVIRTTFHPDTDYASFVGAYKPTTVEEEVMTVIGTKAVPVENADGTHRTESKIVYEFVQQAFLQAYTQAWKKYANAANYDSKHYSARSDLPLFADKPSLSVKKQFLVIEEINRGNCAQIFGDLFQLLDRNDAGFSDYPITADADMKRQLAKAFKGLEVEQAEEINALYDGRDVVGEVLSGDILLLPNNLYIWATMNTSDQSLFPIDSAFKRRWDWKYVPIAKGNDNGAELNWMIEVDDDLYDWWTFVRTINKHVFDTTNSEDKQLGFFFCKAKDSIISAETFVCKVIFYLWNDVFKDFGFDDSIFEDKEDNDNPKLLFDKFYLAKGEVNDGKVKMFLGNLGMMPVDTGGNKEKGNNEDNSSENRYIIYNGEKYSGTKFIDILEKVIKAIGPERVHEVVGKNLVVTKDEIDSIQGEADRNAVLRHPLGNDYFLRSNRSSIYHKQQLTQVKEALNLNLEF